MILSMKKSNMIVFSIFILLCLIYCKKSTEATSIITELEGKWHGTEQGIFNDVLWTFTFSGQSINFSSIPTPGEIHRGTFTLNTSAMPKQLNLAITSSSDSQYEGKVALCIYELENEILRICGSEPGAQTRPAVIGETGTRTWVLNKQPEW
jgi:uncharacterized protein (TIGR03067 family)